MIDPTGVSDVFRREWPRLVATLVRDVRDLDLAEDVAQEAFIEAATRWPGDGMPDRPGAWLLTTARRKAIDRARRSTRYHDRLPELEARARAETGRAEHELVDDQLALLLGCCHPALSPDAQVALTLRVVAGLSTAQIAKAFFVNESTMTRRLTRSKTKIRAAGIPFGVSDMETLLTRLPVVCGVIYSIFTEGHTSATTAGLVRGDLCDEAIWLGELLRELVPGEPEVCGLLALMLLIDARRATRVDGDGVPVLLADQDRSAWDRDKIERGFALLAEAHSHGVIGTYQLQAAIAAMHASAPTFDDTDWPAIVRLYDVILARRPSAVVALNRAVAVSHADGPEVGLAAIDAIGQADDLDVDLADYPYFHSSRAELLASIGRVDAARGAFERALALTSNEAQVEHLRRRLDRLGA